MHIPKLMIICRPLSLCQISMSLGVPRSVVLSDLEIGDESLQHPTTWVDYASTYSLFRELERQQIYSRNTDFKDIFALTGYML